MASFTWALNISVFVKDPAWQDASVKQMDYLRTQDSNTHRVPFDELPNMNRRLTLESSETDSESIVESPRPKHLRYVYDNLKEQEDISVPLSLSLSLSLTISLV